MGMRRMLLKGRQGARRDRRIEGRWSSGGRFLDERGVWEKVRCTASRAFVYAISTQYLESICRKMEYTARHIYLLAQGGFSGWLRFLCKRLASTTKIVRAKVEVWYARSISVNALD